MYHLVGDCTAEEKKTTTTKTYLLEGLRSNAISNKRHDSCGKRICVLLRVQESQPTQKEKKHRNCGLFNVFLK